jgi:pyruvate formate lyase activating enzyme
MKGLIFNVKRYAIHDGPGIRVTFFMKGCPLSCEWCHNPEGISQEPEEVKQIKRIGDNVFQRTEVVGRSYGVDEIISVLEKDRIFIDRSGGGVTFSGGEPLMQPDFLLEALKACKLSGFHTAIDTSGQFAVEKLEPILPFTDLFLFDLKHLDPARHLEFTGVTNEVILKNFSRITDSNSDIIIRIPVIPGFNDGPEHMLLLRELIRGLKTSRIKAISLLPYHKIGLSKYKKLNRPYLMDDVLQPSKKRMKELREFFSLEGINVNIGG